MLNGCDVGHRVVVRRRLGVGPAGRPLFTDLLGVLLRIDEDRLVIRADSGIEHDIARRDIQAGKQVPPRPTRYSEIAALELVADETWPAPDRDHLGDWLLRAAEGFTSRANSALPIGDPGLPLPTAIDACQTWYAARGLPARITVPLPLRRDVADVLTERGWHAQPVVLVQTAELATVTDPPASAALGDVTTAVSVSDMAVGDMSVSDMAVGDVAAVELATEPSAEFLARTAQRKNGLPRSAQHVLTAVDQVRFAEVRASDGTLHGYARGALSSDQTWLQLGLLEVAPEARRAGLARRIVTALAEWGRQCGASRGFLQVEQDNHAAVALYAALGFHTHHRYVTYREPTERVA